MNQTTLRAALYWLYRRSRFWDRHARLNRSYDKCTVRIMSRILNRTSNCVDVGCHKGDILRQMMALAPDGVHYGFEPLPDHAERLQRDFPKANIFPARYRIHPARLVSGTCWIVQPIVDSKSGNTHATT